MSAIASIELQMSLLLFVALAGYLLASRINQSAVIGQILAGIAIGPSFLNLINYTDFVSSLAHLGAIILLFVIGLEFKLGEIVSRKYAVIALCGVLLPWAAGYFVASMFGFQFGPALLVGTALTATSIAITANVLREMGRLQTPAAKAIIGAAVIDDVLSLLALSVSEQLVNGAFSYAAVVGIAATAFGFLAVGAILGQRVLSAAMVRIDRARTAQRYPEFAFIFAIMIAFLYSMAAELAGLSAIVGAFVAGISLEGIGLRHSKHYKEGAEYLHIIFASIFFVSLGILADVRYLTMDSMTFLAALTVVAVLSKLVGCGLPAWLQGLPKQDALVIGFGMVPRGEVAMVVALIGLNQAIIGQEVYVVLVLMSLLTTMLTPLILMKWLFRQESWKYRRPRLTELWKTLRTMTKK